MSSLLLLLLLFTTASSEVDIWSTSPYPTTISTTTDSSGVLDNSENNLAVMQVSIHAQKVFRFAFNPNLFSWKNGNYGGLTRHAYSYRPSIKGLPDMPYWMRYKYSKRHSAGFIYGVPPKANELLELDVVATNKGTFETGLLRLVVNVSGDPYSLAAPYSVRLKIDNLNLEDIFDAHRLRNLKSLFKHSLWPEAAPDLHLTFIASSLDVGYRRPVKPTQKDGVVLQLGSTANFSKDLTALDRETSPLRVIPSCPRNFKRTSVERHFREKGFAIDWCAFRLLILDLELSGDSTAIYQEVTLPPRENSQEENSTSSSYPVPDQTEREHSKLMFIGEKQVPQRTSLPARSVTAEFLYSAIPACVVFVLTAVTLFALLCVKRRGEPEEQWQAFVESFFLVIRDCFTCCRMNEEKTGSTFLTNTTNGNTYAGHMDPARARRASSVQRQSDTLRRLAQSRDVTPMLQTPTNGGQPPFVPGQPPPPPWMADTHSLMSSPNGSMGPQFGTLDSGRVSLNIRMPFGAGTLDTLQRPAPPPYAQKLPIDQDEGTYLV